MICMGDPAVICVGGALCIRLKVASSRLPSHTLQNVRGEITAGDVREECMAQQRQQRQLRPQPLSGARSLPRLRHPRAVCRPAARRVAIGRGHALPRGPGPGRGRLRCCCGEQWVSAIDEI